MAHRHGRDQEIDASRVWVATRGSDLGGERSMGLGAHAFTMTSEVCSPYANWRS